MKLGFVFILLICINLVFSDGRWEGDIAVKYNNPGFDGNVQSWSNNTIPYYIDIESIRNPKHFYLIRDVVQFLQTVAKCLTFQDVVGEKYKPEDRIRITADGDDNNPGEGCWSYPGKQGGEQVLNLGDGCMEFGNIAHMFLLALGQLHEHTRYDRDEFVEIIPKNIIKGKETNFEKRELGQGEDKTMYDYYSLLHYPTTAWSKDDKSETMKPLNTQYKNIGGSGVLTATDKIKLNLRYACPEVSTGLLLDYVQEVEYRSRMQDRHLEERMKQMEDVISKLPGACNKPWISLTTGCYLFLVDQPRSWWQAQTKCYEEGGYVVEINSQKENDEITNVITSQGYKENHHEFWIGLQDGYGDGNWEWMYSKKRPSYTNWGPGEPSNRNEMCASYASNLLWNDLDCNSKVSRSYSRNALCELKKE